MISPIEKSRLPRVVQEALDELDLDAKGFGGDDVSDDDEANEMKAAVLHTARLQGLITADQLAAELRRLD